MAFQNSGKSKRVLQDWTESCYHFFGWLKSENHMKFAEEYAIYTLEACFSPKMFTNAQNIVCPNENENKTLNGVDIHWLSCKKNFRVQRWVKKVMLTIFLDINDSIAIDFFGKGSPVNNAFHCQIVRQSSPYLLNDPPPKTTYNWNSFTIVASVWLKLERESTRYSYKQPFHCLNSP